MPRQRLAKFDVRADLRAGSWVVKEARTITTPTRKEDARSAVITGAKQQPAATVRAHKRNNQFQEERTYPRSADPRSSKG